MGRILLAERFARDTQQSELNEKCTVEKSSLGSDIAQNLALIPVPDPGRMGRFLFHTLRSAVIQKPPSERDI
jgi:hypothetical protein